MLSLIIVYLAEGIYLAQDTVPTDLINWLESNGPFGIIAALLAYITWILWKRTNTAHDTEIKRLTDELERERVRGDRLESELRARNTDIQEKYVTSLEAAKGVINEAVILMRTTR